MLTGVISGIIASAIVGLIVYLFKTQVNPRVSGYLKKVPNISGTWVVLDITQKSRPVVGYAEIKQRGTIVKADFVRQVHYGGKVHSRLFRHEGWFKSGQFTTLFEAKETPGYIVGTTVMKLSGSGKRLEGLNTYYNHDRGKIGTTEILLQKRTD